MKACNGMEKCRRAFGSKLVIEEILLNVHQRSALPGGGAFALLLLLIEDLRTEAHFAVLKLNRTGHLFRLGCGRRNACEYELPGRRATACVQC